VPALPASGGDLFSASGYAAGMRSIRDTYDVPDETPSPVRMWALMVGVVVLALVLWLVLPDSPVTVAILAVVVLATVFFGVSRVLASRQLNRPPGRNQTPPPSAG
jgi:predicted lysophospholipase L1 biosynthesis ABC-type transport system permease subunit